jgi:hypothetical protein
VTQNRQSAVDSDELEVVPAGFEPTGWVCYTRAVTSEKPALNCINTSS